MLETATPKPMVCTLWLQIDSFSNASPLSTAILLYMQKKVLNSLDFNYNNYAQVTPNYEGINSMSEVEEGTLYVHF